MQTKQIGLILGVSLIFIIVCAMYIKSVYKDQPSDEQIQDFARNSGEYTIENVEFVAKNSEVYSHPFGFYTKVKRKKVCIVKSSGDNKYYALEDYSKGIGIAKFNIEGKNIFLIINNDDYKNPNYGSEQKPIPVLKYYTNEDKKNQFVSEQEYNYAIKEYISFCRGK